jgi:hypothetical protein
MVSFHVVLAGLLVLLAAALVGSSSSAAEEGAVPASEMAAPDTGVVAYYFYGNKRCSTCRKLEAYSKEAVTGGYPSELGAGILQWRAVNTDEPENAHFVTDFELVTKSLVLVEYRDGEVVRWENLKLIWQLVGEKNGFLTYVREATGEFLEAG